MISTIIVIIFFRKKLPKLQFKFFTKIQIFSLLGLIRVSVKATGCKIDFLGNCISEPTTYFYNISVNWILTFFIKIKFLKTQTRIFLIKNFNFSLKLDFYEISVHLLRIQDNRKELVGTKNVILV